MRLVAFSLCVGLTFGAGGASAQQVYGRPTAVVVSGPDVGTEAPDFLLPWAAAEGVGPVGEPFILRNLRGKTVVLVFYPRDFTATCTTEMRSFSEQYQHLFGDQVVVVGISADPLETHARFAATVGIPFRLLTDPDQKVSKKYGSADQEGYNRSAVYVVRPDGRVGYRELRFNALDPKAYADLRKAVQAAAGRAS